MKVIYHALTSVADSTPSITAARKLRGDAVLGKPEGEGSDCRLCGPKTSALQKWPCWKTPRRPGELNVGLAGLCLSPPHGMLGSEEMLLGRWPG